MICLAALATATLQTLGEFRLPAAVPSILNLCWIAGAWFIAPRVTADREGQAFVMAGCVLVGGLLQLLVQLPRLRRLGFRFQFDFAASRAGLVQIIKAMAPTTLGLAVTQINTLSDSLIACGLAAAPGRSTIAWLGGVACPLKQGAAAAIWYGERIYQFPVGLLGVGVATVIFPLLARHAAAGQRERIGSDLSLGLRLVLLAGIPASAGLFLIAEPLARLLFQHHNFTAADTPRAAAMIAWFSIGVWAYCAIPVLVRGFYAIGDRTTPVRIGVACVAINIALDLTLIWPLGEIGLAVSTAISAAIQATWLAYRFSRSRYSLDWQRVLGTFARTIAATVSMAAATVTVFWLVPESQTISAAVLRLALATAVAIVAFLSAIHIAGGTELRMLFGAPSPAITQTAP
jgi:putative peptidoglycan lipid II flippase